MNRLLLLVPLLCCTACNEKEEKDAVNLVEDVVETAASGGSVSDVEKLVVDGVTTVEDVIAEKKNPATKV